MAEVKDLKKAFKEMPLVTAFLMILDLEDKFKMTDIHAQ